MMRLLIATDNYVPRWDGITRFLTEVVPPLEQHYKITVAAPNFPPSHKQDGVERFALSRFGTAGFRMARWNWAKMAKLVRHHDVVFVQTLGPIGAMALVLAKKMQRPSLYYTHSLEWELVPRAMPRTFVKPHVSNFLKRYSRHLYNKADLLLVPSQGILDQLSWQGIHRPKAVVRMGCDTSKFCPGNKIQVRSELKLPQDALIIGYHGRISREKDIPTLMRGFTRVRKQIPNAHLLIVGEGEPGLMDSFRHRPGVILPGNQHPVVPYLQAMDIYCLPSLTETTCLSVLEAMSCELPVLSTPVGYVRDYIKDGQNGLFFPFGDNYALSQQLIRLTHDATLHSRIGHAARSTVVHDFKWSDTVKGILVGLHKILHR